MPEIRKNMQIIAKEEVEVDRLGQEIAALEKKQDKDRTDLMSLRSRSRQRQKQLSTSPAAPTRSIR